jgi:hypothetical protein
MVVGVYAIFSIVGKGRMQHQKKPYSVQAKAVIVQYSISLTQLDRACLSVGSDKL